MNVEALTNNELIERVYGLLPLWKMCGPVPVRSAGDATLVFDLEDGCIRHADMRPWLSLQDGKLQGAEAYQWGVKFLLQQPRIQRVQIAYETAWSACHLYVLSSEGFTDVKSFPADTDVEAVMRAVVWASESEAPDTRVGEDVAVAVKDGKA